MTTWTNLPPWSKPTGITVQHMLDWTNDLTWLKQQLDAATYTVTHILQWPNIRTATQTGTYTWNTGRAYNAGYVVVFLNGLYRRKGADASHNDWYESNPATGEFAFNFPTLATDVLLIWDWTP